MVRCNARIRWLDPFDVSSCCREDNFERDNGKISAWSLYHSECQPFAHPGLAKKKHLSYLLRVVLCKTCGRRWFREMEIKVAGRAVEHDKRYWTVVSHGKKGA